VEAKVSQEKFVNFQMISCLLLGFILIGAIPVSFGVAQNWFIPLADGYRISFFYAAEIIIFGAGLFFFPLRLDSSEEKLVFISLLLIMLTRIISLLFASKVQIVQYISIARYLEVGLAIFIISNLVTNKKNFKCFIVGIFLGAMVESIGGILKFTLSDGTVRGILVGIPSYQIQLYVFLICVFLFSSSLRKKWLFTVPISIVLWGIVCTETRSAYLQLVLCACLLLWWGWRAKKLKKILPIIFYSVLFLVALSFTLNKTTKLPESRRIEQVAEGGGTVGWRFYLWDKSLGAFFQNPILGIGSGGFARQINELPQVFNVKINDFHKSIKLTSHNTVLGILAETGIVGFFAYLIWFVAIFKLILAIHKETPSDFFALAASLMVFIFLISDFWSQNSFYPNSNFLIALMIGRLKFRRNDKYMETI